MQASGKFAIILGLAGAFGAAPILAFAQSTNPSPNDGSVQAAIRFEKAKQAAAERQERIDEGLAAPASAAAKAATPSKSKTAPRTTSATLRKPAPPK